MKQYYNYSITYLIKSYSAKNFYHIAANNKSPDNSHSVIGIYVNGIRLFRIGYYNNCLHYLVIIKI